MPQLIPLMRQRYTHIAKDLLGPFLDTLSAGRAVCDGDLDRLVIVLAVAMRTAEHADIEAYDLAAIMAGQVERYPSLTTNVRSIAESTGIPRETVRRKVATLVADGWVVRTDHSLSLAPTATRMLTEVREQILLLAVRNHQTILALQQDSEGEPQDR